MLIILSLYALIAWLVFSKFQLLPWNKLWKTIVYGIALTIGLVVIGALQYYTPVSAFAVVQSSTQKISPLVGGRVLSVNVGSDQRVTAGELLFQIDPEPYQYALNQRAAALVLAKIRLRDTRTLVEKQAAARSTLDLRIAELDQAQAQYDSAEFELENTSVVAPTDGVVSLSVLTEGEVVTASMPLMNFVRISDARIASSFKQNGMEKIEEGTPVTVIFSAAPGEIYQSFVEIVPLASVQGQLTAQDTANPLDAIMSGTSLYPVQIAFPEDAPEYLRRPGSQASITVFTDEGNPINILARIVQWIGTWMAFIF